MQLFWTEEISKESTEYSFSKEESRHIVKVLRKKEGDVLAITNGKGLEAKGKIIYAHEKKCLVSILESFMHKKPRNYSITIAIAPTKNMDRLEWFIEKCTEIGVDSIQPILCKHSERKAIKMERLDKIMVAAAKQSLKYHFPSIKPLCTFKEFIQNNDFDAKYIAHCREDAQTLSFFDSLNTGGNSVILIGPEGDFNREEISLALQAEYKAVSLGKARLRTETAGVVACHTAYLKNTMV